MFHVKHFPRGEGKSERAARIIFDDCACAPYLRAHA
jgi:hypothetical protein